MLLQCWLLALAAFALSASRAACIDVTHQPSIFSKVQRKETVLSTTITEEIPYMPPMMIIGNSNGSITRCPIAEPESCEVYHTGQSPVTAVVVHGEYLFAALESGTMLRCPWHRRHSCYEFNHAGGKIIGLAVAAGFIHAGLHNGTILRCQLGTPHSCWNYADVHRNITSLYAFDSFLYAGSNYGRIDRCSLISKQNCSKLCGRYGSNVVAIAYLEDKIYALKSGSIQLTNMRIDHTSEYLISHVMYTMAMYKRILYMIRRPVGVYTHDPNSKKLDTQLFSRNSNAISISFAYGTFSMQNKYQTETENCIWDSDFPCPPTVVYYDVGSRAQWEVSVKGGRLYDSQGALMDTSDADESHSQTAALFVMGPDGQILVSKFHRRGHTHASSLLAGGPVAGAGLMVVEQGRVRNITACSVHYRPDVDLNAQVIESLYVKGYTDSIDSYPCEYSTVLCNADDI